MTTYPLPTLAATVTPAGISIPSFTDVLESLKAIYRGIYGSDVYLDPDSQDGQWLAAIASAINDVNNASVFVYQQFSPATAMGAGLSSVVKINGLARLVATNSTVNVTLTGVAGTEIDNGVVQDVLGNKWNLPPVVTIGGGGTVVVTATAQEVGDIAAAPGTVTTIVTPTRNWQSVTNSSSAVLGAPVESDATLRRRQSVSTDRSASAMLDAISAEVLNVDGVTRLAAYENDTGSTDGNGLLAHSIELVVEGGDASEIANAIFLKKAVGIGTNGNTSQTVVDGAGVSHTINFSTLTLDTVEVSIVGTQLAGYTSATVGLIQQAVTDYINSLPIGFDVYYNKIFGPANLDGTPQEQTFVITTLQIRKTGGSFGTSDLSIAFNEAASIDTSHVTVSIT